MKLWRYVFCPFYISFAPYIVLSMLIVWATGCTVKATDTPKALNEYNMDCSDDVTSGALGLVIRRCVNKEVVCYSLYQHALQCFKIGDTNESCKFPQPNK